MPLRVLEKSKDKVVVYCKVHDTKMEGKTYREAELKLKDKLHTLKLEDYYDDYFKGKYW